MTRKRNDKRKTSLDATVVVALDPIEELVTRARKLAQKGETRKALVLLRDATLRDEWRARTWTIYGAFLLREGQRREGERVLKQAKWLHAREGSRGRVAAIERLMTGALPHAA